MGLLSKLRRVKLGARLLIAKSLVVADEHAKVKTRSCSVLNPSFCVFTDLTTSAYTGT